MNMTEINNARIEQEELFAKTFIHDPKNKTITVNISYPYVIELNRIPGPTALLEWSHHLGKKGWMTARLLAEFIRVVAEIKGWNIYKDV